MESTEHLREMLKKLKDKEMKLEADLAIKEHPELEKGIIEVILLISDVRKAERGIKVIKRVDEKKRMEVLKEQIEYCEKKLTAYRAALEEINSEDKTKRMRSDRELAVKKLNKCYKEWQELLVDSNVDLKKLIPPLEDYLS